MPVIPTTYSLPFAHLNLRRNPFGEFSEDERTALALVDVDAVIERLNDPLYVVQFIGEKGYGKTTHLLAIRSHLNSAGYMHIPEGERASIPASLFCDQTLSLPLNAWSWLVGAGQKDINEMPKTEFFESLKAVDESPKGELKSENRNHGPVRVGQ